jgi:hypothetical protein
MIEAEPQLPFEEISMEMPNWEERLGQLIKARLPIKYHLYGMPNILKFEFDLTKQRYEDRVLASNKSCHFLVPL